MKKTRFLLFITCFLLVSQSLSSEGGPDIGLFFGGNLGFGCDFIQPIIVLSGESSIGKTRISSSLLTDLKIGYNFNERFGILFSTCNNWEARYTAIILLNSYLIGCRYYVPSGLKSIFLDALVGYGFWLYPFDPTWNDYYSGKGFSFAIGGGYTLSESLYYHECSQ